MTFALHCEVGANNLSGVGVSVDVINRQDCVVRYNCYHV